MVSYTMSFNVMAKGFLLRDAYIGLFTQKSSTPSLLISPNVLSSSFPHICFKSASINICMQAGTSHSLQFSIPGSPDTRIPAPGLGGCSEYIIIPLAFSLVN